MYSIGIDLGGTNVAFGLVSEDGKLVRKESVATDRNATAEGLTEIMAKKTLEFICDFGTAICKTTRTAAYANSFHLLSLLPVRL